MRAVEQSPSSIIITNPLGEIQYVNPRFTEVTGYAFAEVYGKNPRILKSGLMDEKVYSELWETISKGGEWRGELANKNKEGKLYWEMASISGLKNEKGIVTHFLAVKENITTLKKHEKEIDEKNIKLNEINVQKDIMFSILAHDLRGPFNGLIGLSGLMSDESGNISLEEMRDLATTMRKSAQNIFDLLTNLLEWSRLQQGIFLFRPEPIVLSDLISDISELFADLAKQKNIAFNIMCPTNIQVLADNYVLQTVIRNLLANAIKFTKSNGQISFTATPDNKGNLVVCKVSDNGIGMSSEIVENLFRIDIKTNRTGTNNEPSSGLGLILCKEFVELHGSKLTIESSEGGGSVFSFSLQTVFNEKNDHRADDHFQGDSLK